MMVGPRNQQTGEQWNRLRELRAETRDLRLLQTYRFFAILGVLAVSSFIIAKCFTALGDYDAMYNSILPKNFSIGAGYKTTYPAHQGYVERDRADQDRHFNVEITTGPSVLFFQIPFLKIFHSKYWVPSVSTATLSAILMAVALLWMWRLWPEFGRPAHTRPYWFGLVAVFLLLLISLTADAQWPENIWGVGRVWFEAAGEFPASLFTLLGGVILFSRGQRAGWAAVAGLCLGLAILAKSLAAIGCGVVAVSYLVWCIHRQGRLSLSALLSFTLVVAIMGGLFMAYGRFVDYSLGSPEAIQEWHEANRLLFDAVGSGLFQFKTAPDKLGYLLTNLSEHIKSFFRQYTVLQAALIIAASGALIGGIFLGAKRARRTIRPGEALGLALMGAVVVHYGWWFVLEHYAWIRRATQANILLAFALALLLAQTNNRRLRLLATCMLVGAAVLGSGFWRFLEAYPSAFTKEPRLVALEQIMPLLSGAENEGYIFLGCQWSANREVDYVMPTARTVYDCTKIQPAGWGKHALLVRGFYWNLAADDIRVRAVQDACERNVLISNQYYTVSRCPDDTVEQSYMWSGFYGQEAHGRWMGRSGIRPILTRERESDLRLLLTSVDPDRAVRPVVGSLEVKAGEETLLTRSFEINASGSHQITLPQSVMAKGDRIVFNVDRTFIPAQRGLGPDTRPLGLLVTTVVH